MATTAQDVYDAFEATFVDNVEIAETLEAQWLKMAIARYNQEVAIDETTTLSFDSDANEFADEVNPYIVNTLGMMIKELYCKREFSRATKIASIVGKDLSVNGTNGLQKYTKEDLDNCKLELSEMISALRDNSYEGEVDA